MTLNIKIHLNAIMERLITLANQDLLLDTNGDRVIDISTDNDDGIKILESK